MAIMSPMTSGSVQSAEPHSDKVVTNGQKTPPKNKFRQTRSGIRSNAKVFWLTAAEPVFVVFTRVGSDADMGRFALGDFKCGFRDHHIGGESPAGPFLAAALQRFAVR